MRSRAGRWFVAALTVAGCSTARAAQTTTTTRAASTTDAPAPDPATTEPPTASTTRPTTTSTTSEPATTATQRPPSTTTDPLITTPATTPTTTTTTPAVAATTTTTTPTLPATTTTTTTIAPLDDVVGAVPLPHLANAVQLLRADNAAASVTVWRDHVPIFNAASGTTNDGTPMTSDSPMVQASVSKLITALTIARLAEQHLVDVAGPVPWDRMGIAHDPGWDDVTVRELLDHTSGMPKAQNSWLNDPGSCAIPLTTALSLPPRATRGEWTYSNGNYCALGLLIETVTGARRDSAADLLVFAPIGVTGAHLSTDGVLANDAPYSKGVARLERLGGAGTWLASTDDLAAMLDSVTSADLATLHFPGIIVDQYGWGHTGTLDGAKSCAWVIEGGRTIVVATVSGEKPSTGGKVCDIVTPSLALDLGIWADTPVRTPD